MTPRRGARNRTARSRSGSRGDGQVLAIFSLALITIVVFVGLVIDGGVAFLNRREAQNVADTAAMAGTKIVTEHYTVGTRFSNQVYAAINTNVSTSNGCASGNATPCSWTASYVSNREVVLGPVVNTDASLPAGTQGVIVNVTRTPRTFFLGVIGQTTWHVTAPATGMTAGITHSPSGTLLPIATNPPTPYVPGKTYTLTNIGTGGGSSPSFGPGNFGWLSWFGTTDANSLTNSVCHPDNPGFDMPVDFPGDNGASNKSALRACLDTYIADGTQVLIPIVDKCVPCNGSHAVFTIIGIAAFTLTSYAGNGPAIDTLNGSFIEYYPLLTVSAGTGAPPPSAGDPTIYVGLVR